MKTWKLEITPIEGTTPAAALPSEANKIVAECVQEFGKLLSRRLDTIGLTITGLVGQPLFTFEGNKQKLNVTEFAGVHIPA